MPRQVSDQTLQWLIIMQKEYQFFQFDQCYVDLQRAPVEVSQYHAQETYSGYGQADGGKTHEADLPPSYPVDALPYSNPTISANTC